MSDKKLVSGFFLDRDVHAKVLECKKGKAWSAVLEQALRLWVESQGGEIPGKPARKAVVEQAPKPPVIDPREETARIRFEKGFPPIINRVVRRDLPPMLRPWEYVENDFC